MSPIRTFHSSGNSSNLYFRSTAPNGVIRLSPFTETELPECLTVIERNLYIVNNRPCFPTRFCLNIAEPPGIFIWIKAPTTNKIGDNKIKPKSEAPRSKRDLKNIRIDYISTYQYFKAILSKSLIGKPFYPSWRNGHRIISISK